MTQYDLTRYGGRAAGAAAAFFLLRGKVPGGALGIAAVVLAGWIAGGYLTDRFLLPVPSVG